MNIFCIRPRGLGLNVGNETIFVALRELLLEAFDDDVNLIQIDSRSTSGGLGGLSSRSIHEINQYGDGVVVGGGNLYENNDLDVDRLALPRLQPPLMLFSLSRGRIYGRHGALVDRTDVMPDDVIRGLHDAASISLARDRATAAHLAGIGIEDAQLGGCPTILLGTFDLALPKVSAALAETALLSIRHPQLMNVPLRQQAAVHRDVVAMVAELRSRGYRTRLLCHDLRDLTFAASLGDVEILYPGSAANHLAALRRAALVVTYRLHSHLPCLSFGTPVVNISYDERSSSLTETLGVDAWDVDLMTTDDLPGAVFERIDRLDELDALRLQAKPRWDELAGTMRSACATFADLARRHAAQPS